MKTDKTSYETDKNYVKYTKQISEIEDWIEEIKNGTQLNENVALTLFFEFHLKMFLIQIWKALSTFFRKRRSFHKKPSCEFWHFTPLFHSTKIICPRMESRKMENQSTRQRWLEKYGIVFRPTMGCLNDIK